MGSGRKNRKKNKLRDSSRLGSIGLSFGPMEGSTATQIMKIMETNKRAFLSITYLACTPSCAPCEDQIAMMLEDHVVILLPDISSPSPQRPWLSLKASTSENSTRGGNSLASPLQLLQFMATPESTSPPQRYQQSTILSPC